MGVIVSSGQTLVVSSGQTSSGVTVLSSGEEILSGGTASASIVSGGGVEVISANGVEVGGTVTDFDATLTVLDGGTASNTTVTSGGALLVSGGVTSNDLVSGGTPVAPAAPRWWAEAGSWCRRAASPPIAS